MRKKGLVARRNEGVETNRSLKQDLPREVEDIIWYIQDEFQKPVWLLGLRGMYALGVPFYRNPEEITVYSPITKAEKSNLDDYLRKKYKKIVGRRSDLGTTYFFPHSCLLDVNRVDEYIETHYTDSAECREKNQVKVAKDVFVLVPQIEDLLIMKLIAGRTKDIRDVRYVLGTSRSWIDMNKLESRAREAGVESKLSRLLRLV